MLSVFRRLSVDACVAVSIRARPVLSMLCYVCTQNSYIRVLISFTVMMSKGANIQSCELLAAILVDYYSVPAPLQKRAR
jgi:hypothetical protein